MNYKVFSVRWLFLAVLVLGTFIDEFTASSYGIVNNVITEFFGEGVYGTDVLGSLQHSLGLVIFIVTILFRKYVGFRSQIITACVCISLGTFAVTLAFISRIYWLALAGQLIIGFAGAIFFILQIILGTLWFHAGETATVFSACIGADSTGATAASIVFSNVFSNTTDSTAYSVSIEKVSVTFMGSVGALCAVLSAFTVAVCIFATDRPPSPPSASQNLLTKKKECDTKSSGAVSNIRTTLKLWKNKNFFFIAATRSLIYSEFVLVLVLLSSVMVKTFPELHNSYPGWIRTTATTMGVITSIISGRILDRTRQYKKFALVAIACLTACSMGIYFSHLSKFLIGVTILYPMMYMFHCSVAVSLSEFVNEIGYETDSILLAVNFLFPSYTSAFFFVTIERWALETWDESAAVLVVFAANILSIILISCVKSDFKRSKIDHAHNAETSEEKENLIGPPP